MMIHETSATTRTAVHDEAFRFRCGQCLKVLGQGSSCGTGYAIAPDETLRCYACCGANDRAELTNAKPGDRFTHYITRDKDGHYRIVNWPGTLKIHPFRVKVGRHNIGRTRLDAWFSYAGKAFHAVNIGDSQIARIRALKG